MPHQLPLEQTGVSEAEGKRRAVVIVMVVFYFDGSMD
jgi:hypothetical protein